MPFPLDFTTERLAAERLLPGHLEDIRRMHSEREQMAHLGGVRTDEQTDAYMVKNLRHWDDYGFGTWVLRERSSGEVVGRAVLRHLVLENADETEVGYGFFTKWWGKGFAQEITRACLAHARERLGATSVVALTSPDNLRSHNVLLKCGLLLEREIDYERGRHSLFRTAPGWAGAE